jgi:hypothetical protein
MQDQDDSWYDGPLSTNLYHAPNVHTRSIADNGDVNMVSCGYVVRTGFRYVVRRAAPHGTLSTFISSPRVDQ